MTKSTSASLSLSRIAIFRSNLLPPSETFIKAQAEAVNRYEISYIGFYPEPNSLPLDRQVVLLCSARSWVADRWVRFYHRFGIAPAFHRRLKARRPVLIHAHFGRDGIYATQVAKTLRTPLLVTLHGYDVSIYDYPYAESYKTLWAFASRFICISEYVRRRALASGFPEEKLRVHYTGVDLEAFSIGPGRLAQSCNRVLFVGRVVEKKGLGFLITAMRAVQEVVPEASLMVIGDGPLRSGLEARARELGVNCSFMGSRDAAYIRTQLEDATVFCGPSVEAADGDAEGLGMVFLEAQALGVPVVATTHGGIPEAVIDGKTGLLAPPGDSDALAERLVRYLRDPELRRAHGEAGMAWVRARFDLSKQTGILEEIYREVIEEEAAARRR